VLRKSENFIISTDSFYNKCIKDNLLQGLIKEDILLKIESNKTNHREFLVKFKDDYEVSYQKEKNYKKDLKNKKSEVQDFINLGEAFRNTLSKEDQIFLNLNIQ